MSSILGSILRRNVSKVVLVPQFESKILEEVKNGAYKPRHHPGRRSNEVIKAPDKVHDAAKIIVSKIQEPNLKKDGEVMGKYMKARQVPAEKSQVVENMHRLKSEVISKIGLDGVDIEETYDEYDVMTLDHGIRREVNKLLKQTTYNWEAVNYTDYIARVYLWNRFVPEYAALVKVLEEIKKQVADFEPHSVFDFGSGIGTAIWATHSYWSEHIQEFYCVDTSASMLDISSLLIQGGRQNRQPDIRHVVYRQFLPASTANKYSLVICAYSLLELASQRQRIEVLASLWKKTEDFLIIVESGSVSGNQVVLEARDFILGANSRHPGTVHVLSPCPHDQPCPKLQLAHHCNFAVKYENLKYGRGERNIQTETFSYVILRRGERQDTLPPWPRIVRPVQKRSKHTVCKLCTSEGELAQIVFTNKKQGVIEHRCVKGSKWGDLLPISIGKKIMQVEDDGDGSVDDIDDDDDDEDNESDAENGTHEITKINRQ